MATKLTVKNLAQIKRGTIEFGDFTLLVGPQASGKSILLQMLKLAVDHDNMAAMLKTNGYDWGTDVTKFFELVFGEGMGDLWKPSTEFEFEGKKYTAKEFLPKKGSKQHQDTERLFYVIAQRVVAMYQGWPRAFGAYDIGDPYVLKSFSETLRQLIEKEALAQNNSSKPIFPRPRRIMEPIRELIDTGIFHGATVEMDRSSLKKRLLLHQGNASLPFMTWSAGQKEFMPLLLALYHLLPASKITQRTGVEWVIVEEPEMGLHPQAIRSLMIVFLELIQRGYKLVISTHSPMLLELMWAMGEIQALDGTSDDLYKLFDLPKTPGLTKIFKSAIADKRFATYYFDRRSDGVYIKDISSLDAGAEDGAIANWGGISEFAGRAAEIVATLAARAN